MGSLNANGIPVVGKTDTTYRKGDIRITRTNSQNDTIANIVTTPVMRTITSGSIVREDGTVEYFEDLVFGVTRMGRTCLERIASDEDCARQVVVDLAGNQTTVVIETSLQPDTPQLSARHHGDQISIGQAVGDIVVERVPNSGVFDTGFPL